jgi:hypothetical protein
MSSMVHCLRCGATRLYDPDHYVPHVLRRATAERLATLEFEARSRLNALGITLAIERMPDY